ncbi:TonB-dependent siderophore receptor [Thaumasiovibrio subtropicus]|uniref:TonB-dependent siderophore receptor n=1 Tax=Thaumasiovibrio subtropicus TaxID=1891207 RepID=UPI000B36404C|nr:TonB-dependent siderophore receptor [Thaumasiovibrio subtropicus]
MKTGTYTVFRRSPLALLIAGVLTQPVAFAEDAETVQVWGAKVSSSSEFLDNDDISIKQADHMSDLLRDVPGVDVGGTHSINQRIAIRGLRENDLDIRLDGASQYARMFHHVGNLTLNPDIIKAVDIQVGANSVASNGIGGAVYFETKDARDMLYGDQRWGTRAYGGFATNDYLKGSVTSYGLLTDSVDALVYYSLVDRNNFEDGNGDESLGNEGDVGNLLAKLGWQLTDTSRLQLSYDVYRDEGDYRPRADWNSDANDGRTGKQLVPTEYDRDTTTLSHTYDGGDAIFLKTSIYYNLVKMTRDETHLDAWPGNRKAVVYGQNVNSGLTAKAVSKARLGSTHHTLTYGIDYNRQKSSNQFGTYAQTEKAYTTAFFLENKINFNDVFSITPGVRFDHFDRQAATGSDSFNDITWGLAADWHVNEKVTLFASTRSLFKAPQLIETFIAYQDVSILKPGTVAQTGRNDQIGVRFQHDSGDHQLSSSLTVFNTELEDYLIDEWDRDVGGYVTQNDGDVEYKGFEAAFHWGYKDLSTRLSYSRSDNRHKTDGGPIVANGGSTDIGDAIGLNVNYDLFDYGLTFGWTSQFVLKEDNVVEGAKEKESYNVHNIYAQWLPHQVDGLQVTLGVDNLFDEAYYSHASKYGYPSSRDNREADDFEPGRNIKLSVAYQF